MSARPFLRAPIALIALLLACSEEPTGLDPVPVEDLAFTFIEIDPERLIASDHVVETPPADGPMPTENWWGDELPTSTTITDARTIVGIYSYGASAIGIHKYTGNVGRVETKLEVAYKGQHLGSRRGARQISTPFVLDFGRVKEILVQVRLYTDKQCGLEAHAGSDHSAWWEFFHGTGTSTWGRNERSSQARPATGPECGEREDDRDPTGAHEPNGGLYCHYLITYDLDTGVIYDVTLLYCSTGTLF